MSGRLTSGLAGKNALGSITGTGGGAGSRSLGYDDAGNLDSDTGALGSRTYGIDALSRVASAYQGTQVLGSYGSNGLNQRAWKSAGAR